MRGQIPVRILPVLWTSIDASHKRLDTMKLRIWANELLQRSVLLGSTQEGVSMQYVGYISFLFT